jgi:hypothetical protein
MSQLQNSNIAPVPLEEIQKSWSDLTLHVAQLETANIALEAENKKLRSLVERVVEHRQKSHGELVNLIATLVSRLPLNDVGVVVARLVEHNHNVTEVSASLIKGKLDDNLLQPAILKQLDKTKRDLLAAYRPEVDHLLKLDTPFEPGMLQSLLEKPDNFFTPAFCRANRGFVKGQLPRERIIREFGEEALIFFKDVTTDVKFNPRPKPEEIMLAFKPEFAELLQQNPNVAAAKRTEIEALHRKVRQSRENTEQARAQKDAFLRLSFLLELIHYYENQNTESPDVVFAQRLPPLIEQLVITGEGDTLDENLIKAAETLLAVIISHDHRKSVINNIGKGGGLPRTLRYTLAFRIDELTEMDPITMECVKHLIPRDKVPSPEALTAVLRLFNKHMQLSCLRAISTCERLRKEDAEKLAKTLAQQLGFQEVVERMTQQSTLSPEKEREVAWNHIKDLIASRATPADIVAALRKRFHSHFDSDEVKLSWLALTDTDPMVFVRVFCLLPYLPNGQTDPIARHILEAYSNRLTHEKYAATYAKVLHALKNLFKVKADSPALINFIALVRWVDPDSANKLAHDIGMNAA